jgi:hypothetical protein
MTDRAFDPPSDDPFEQIAKGRNVPVGGPPSAANDDEDDPFAKIAKMGGTKPEETSAAGAFVHGAERGVAPSIGSLPAIGYGAETGLALGGPWGALAGGIVGGLGGGYVIGKAQDWLLHQLPSSWTEAIGQDDRQQQLEQAQHPTASFLGGLAPYALTMRPGAIPRGAVPDNATALQRIMANPVTARVFGGGLMGGMELGQEAVHGEVPDWTKIAISTGFGLVFNKPTRLGESIIETGGRGARVMLGRPEPTLAQAADARVAGPGIDENVFLGSHEQATGAALTAQDAARTEKATTAEPAVPDIHEIARRMDPDTIDEYRALQARYTSLQAWVTELGGTDSYQHLRATTDEMAKLEPRVRAAYRRAAEVTGHPMVEPETAPAAPLRTGRPQVDALLADPEVANAIANPKINRANDVPYEAGASQGADTTTNIDQRVPEIAQLPDGSSFPTAPPLNIHEQIEKAAMERLLAKFRADHAREPNQAELNRIYEIAHHEFAEPAEDAWYRARGLNLEMVNKFWADQNRITEHENPANPPANLYKKPYPHNKVEGVKHPETGVAAEWPTTTAVPGIQPAVGRPGELPLGGIPGKPPIPIGADTAQPAAPAIPVPARPRTIEEQRAYISDDVERQLLAAGRPSDEAKAAGALIAARYETRAARFNGALGTAEELYEREGAEIIRQGQRSQMHAARPAIATNGPAARAPETFSLLEFLASKGGLKPDPDLTHIAGANKFVPGFGQLFRSAGMTMDQAVQAAKDGGYLFDAADVSGAESHVGPNDLHALIAKEANQREKQYPLKREDIAREGATTAEQKRARESADDEAAAHQDRLDGELNAALKAVDIDPKHIGDTIRARTLEIMDREHEADPIAAYERAVMEDDQHATEAEGAPARDEEIPGWDVPHEPGAAPAAGGATEVHPPEAGRGAREGGAGDREARELTQAGGIVAFHGSPHDFNQFHLPDNGAPLHFTDSEGLASSPRYRGDNGTTYQTRLHIQPHEMLNLDSTLSQQKPEIQARLRSIGVTDANMSGYDIQNTIGAKRLQEAGIPGAQRAAFDSHTYLVYDPSRVEITHKNGAREFEQTRPNIWQRFKSLTAHLLGRTSAEIADVEPLVRRFDPNRFIQPEPAANLNFGPNDLHWLDNGGDSLTGRITPATYWFVTDENGATLAGVYAQWIWDYARNAGHYNYQVRLWRPSGTKTITPAVTKFFDTQAAAREFAEWSLLAGRYADIHPEDIPATVRDTWDDPTKGFVAAYQREHGTDPNLAEIVQDRAERELRATEAQRRRSEIGIAPVPEDFQQGARGKIRFLEGEPRATITLMRDANASTFIHEEGGHDWLEQLMRDAEHPAAPDDLKRDAAITLKWLGVERREEIKSRQHEKFARGFEQYMRLGIAPSKELAGVFAQFKSWLLQIYQTLSGLGMPISDDIRGVFDRMLSTSPEHTVIAPGREPEATFGATHAADAEATHPRESAAAADLIFAERARDIQESPSKLKPEVRHELETAAAEDATEQAAATAEPGAGAGIEPGGEVAGGEHGTAEVAPDRGAAGPEPAGGGAGGGLGEERGRGGEAAAKGPELPGTAEQRRGTAENARDQPLAPGPAASLGARESPFTDKAGNIRIENLTTRQDVAQAIRDSAEENNDFIGDRRGVVTDGQVMDLADSLGMDFDKLMQRKVGDAFNAEQVVAARKLLIESATQVSVAMKKAATGTDEDIMAYAIAKDRHQMIQGQVAGITAEAGRALRAFRDISGQEGAQNVDAFIRQATGKTLFQLKMEAKLGAQLDTPGKISKFLNDAQKRSFGGMILEYWINGLISGVATHVTYMQGNLILALEKAGPETLAAAAIGRARAAAGRQGERVLPGESLAQLRGAVQGIPGSLQAGIEAMRTGQTTLLPGETARPLMPFQGDTSLAIARTLTNDPVTWREVGAQAFATMRGIRDAFVSGSALLKAGGIPGAPLIGAQYSPLGQIPDIAVRGVPVIPVGSALRIPGRSVAAIHSFFRSLNYAMAKSAEAYRQASSEGLEGTAFAARIGDLWQNPPEAVMGRARAEATNLTLMGHGGVFVKALSQLTNAKVTLPLIGELAPLKFIDPFVHIGANVINQAIVQRTPVGVLSAEIRRDLMGHNGSIAQDMAQARMLCGTALSLLFGGLAMEGYASGSGPSDPKESAMWRLAGNQAHSIRIGDIWYDVHRLGPMGMLMGIAADMYEVAHQAHEGEFLDAAAHLQHAVTQNILDESFMRGPADLIKAIEDPGRYGDAYIRNFLSSFVPFSVGLSQQARAMDPYSRQAWTVVDQIKAKIPGLSQTLLPRRDIWGQPMPNHEALIAGGVTAIYETRMSHDPVNLAMLDLGINPGQVPRKIRNVDLTDQQFDDFARIAGVMAKSRLDTIVNAPDYRGWPNHVRHDVIQEVIKQSRETARGVMMTKYPQIMRDAVAAKMERFED